MLKVHISSQAKGELWIEAKAPLFLLPKCYDSVVMLLNIKACLKFSASTHWEL